MESSSSHTSYWFIQKSLERGEPEFFFIVNIQVSLIQIIHHHHRQEFYYKLPHIRSLVRPCIPWHYITWWKLLWKTICCYMLSSMEMMPLGTQDLNSYHIFLRLVRTQFAKVYTVESYGHVFHILHCMQFCFFLRDHG